VEDKEVSAKKIASLSYTELRVEDLYKDKEFIFHECQERFRKPRNQP